MSKLTELAIAGAIVRPDDDGWDEARAAWNLAADQRPEVVALVESAEDIAEAMRFAARHDLRVAGQGTGHGAGSLGSLEGTVLIKTERMRRVEIDAEARTARIEAGVLAEEVAGAARESGLSSLPGSSPNVGAIGFTLGGGLSWLGRRFGFACNRVRSIELVTADGEQRTVDADNDPDLFWALRGGGGGYAIVSALQTNLVPLSSVFAGTLLFPAEAGADGIRAYREWAETVSDDVTSIVRFLRPPPMPDVPEPLRDTPLLTVGAACIMDREAGEEVIAPLREIGQPVMDIFDQIPPAGLSAIHMEPEPPVPVLANHQLIRELPDEAIDAFVSVADPAAGSPLLLAELRQLGGALGRPAEDGGALSKLDAAFVMLGVGMPVTPEAGEAINAQYDRQMETMAPWAADGGYLNFADRPAPLEAILPADVCERLTEVKRRWDPDGTIVANHPVAAPTA